MSKKSYRKIVINEVEYKYLVGNHNVSIRSETLNKVVPFTELTGLSPDEIENRKWDCAFAIKPSMIKDYISGLTS